MPKIKLQLTGGAVLDTDVAVIKWFQAIASKYDLENVPESIPIDGLDIPTCKKIIEWVTYHNDHPQPGDDYIPGPGERIVNICEYDREFINLRQKELLEVTLAADYLGVPRLLALACGKAAEIIASRTTEKIREWFEISNDFSPEEQAWIAEEEKYIEEKK